MIVLKSNRNNWKFWPMTFLGIFGVYNLNSNSPPHFIYIIKSTFGVKLEKALFSVLSTLKSRRQSFSIEFKAPLLDLQVYINQIFRGGFSLIPPLNFLILLHELITFLVKLYSRYFYWEFNSILTNTFYL